jgi:mannose-1-phosphate guanylyltransferase
MQAVVLIGGKGTRLRPITYSVPKAMVPLRNKPYIEYLIDSLKLADLDGVVFSMGYLPDPIREHFNEQDMNGFSLQYVVEDQPLGTAGGIKNAEAHLGDGPFVATNGDLLTGLDLKQVIEAHQDSGALATITLTSVENPTAYGLVEVDHRLRVKSFIEKPSDDKVHTSLVNAGIYVLEREVLEMIPKGREVSIEREIFPELQAMGKLRACISSAYWRDIGTPRSYLAASHDVLSGTVMRTQGFEYLQVHPSTSISKNVTMLPPISIAEGCELDAGAAIGGRTALGKDCAVGEGAVVEGSILFDGALVEDGAVVRNSIVGPGAVISEGSIVRGHSVIGAGAVVASGNVLEQGARVAPGVHLPPGAISF